MLPYLLSAGKMQTFKYIMHMIIFADAVTVILPQTSTLPLCNEFVINHFMPFVCELEDLSTVDLSGKRLK